MFGEHEVLVSTRSVCISDVLVARLDASVVWNIDSTRGISLILLVFECLQVAHHLAQIMVAGSCLQLLYVLLTVSFNVVFHHIK